MPMDGTLLTPRLCLGTGHIALGRQHACRGHPVAPCPCCNLATQGIGGRAGAQLGTLEPLPCLDTKVMGTPVTQPGPANLASGASSQILTALDPPPTHPPIHAAGTPYAMPKLWEQQSHPLPPSWQGGQHGAGWERSCSRAHQRCIFLLAWWSLEFFFINTVHKSRFLLHIQNLFIPSKSKGSRWSKRTLSA